MKSKLKNREQQLEDLEDIDESDVDVEAVGPSISSGKSSKIKLIVVSSLIITFVVYLLFFSGTETEVRQQNLEPVFAGQGEAIAKKEQKEEAPLDLDESYNLADLSVENINESLPVPEVPSLPEMPQGVIAKDSDIAQIINEAEKLKQEEEKNKYQAELARPEVNPLLPINNNNLTNNSNNLIDSVDSANPNIVIDKNNDNINLNPRYSPIIVFSGAAQGTPTRSIGYEKNIVVLNGNTVDSLKESKSEIEATIITDRSTTISQGKLINATLETSINTEIPGFVRGIVSKDVYGEAGNDVLIPRGSRLFGSYSSQVKRGQARIEISWTRLIRPDGVDLGISFNASDQFGRAGINGDVDNKYGSIITNSILTSMLTIGGIALTENLLSKGNGASTTTTTTNPSTGSSTSTGSASSQAIYDVSKTVFDTVSTILQDQINADPVITLPQGTKITVVVNADMKIPKMSKN